MQIGYCKTCFDCDACLHHELEKQEEIVTVANTEKSENDDKDNENDENNDDEETEND